MTGPEGIPTPPPLTWEAPGASAPQPFDPNQPMTFGALINRAVWIYRTGFVTLLAVAAIVQVPLAVIGAILGQRLGDALVPFADLANSQPTAEELSALIADVLPEVLSAALLIGIIAFAGGLILSPALIATVARIHSGEPASVGDAYGTALRRLPAIFVGSIVVGFVLAVLFAAVTLVGVLLASQIGPWIIVFALLAAVVLTGYVGLRWVVWEQVVVVEGGDPLDAIGRSWRLLGGSMWRVLGILLGTTLFASIVGAIFGAIGGAIGSGLPLAWRGLVPEILAVLVVPLGSIVTTLLFFDLRARREGPASPPPASSRD